MTKKERTKRRLITLGVVAALIVAIVIGLYISVSQTAAMPTNEQAYTLVKESIDSMASTNATISAELAKNADVKIGNISADGTGCVINVTVNSVDLAAKINSNIEAVTALDEPDENGNTLKSDEVKSAIFNMASEWMQDAEKTETTLDVVCTDVNGTWVVYKSEELAEAVYPGLVSLNSENKDTELKSVKRLATLTEVKYDTSEPDTRNWIQKSIDDVKAQFILNFVEESRWMMIVNGLLKTLEITGVSLVIGVALGIIVAAIRSSFDKNKEEMEKRGGIGYTVMAFLNGICRIYLTIIRGTPVVVQVLIYYFIIFVSVKNGTIVAMLAFGINSGAYVAEIFRGGIMAIDHGQFEAGRSLGFNYVQTMYHVVIPQVFKAVLPTLCNEFIALLKETSIVGYVGEVDLTKAGDLIRGRTFSAFMPLIAVALVYLAIVMLLTFLVGRLERRLRKSER